MDTSICWQDRDIAYLSSDEYKWHRRIRALKDKYPDEVSIKYEPEKNDGCICATFPVEWVKVQPKRIVIMTEDQKKEAAERLKKVRKSK